MAILAGVGAGIYESVADGCNKIVRTKSVTDVNTDNHKKYTKYYNVYKYLYPGLKDSYKALKNADF